MSLNLKLKNIMNQINPVRLKQLFVRQLVINRKGLLIGFAAMMGVLLFISILQTWSNNNSQLSVYYNLGLVIFHIGGYLLTSGAFNELHTPSRSQFYLTLPASNAEKLLVNWFIYSPLYVLAAMAGLVLTSGLGTLICMGAFGTPLMVFNPFESTVLWNIAFYLVIQTIFMLGAVYFRKHNALKTVFAYFLVSTFITIWFILVAFLIFGNIDINLGSKGMTFVPNWYWLEYLVKGLFFGLTGPFFLLVSYFKLKEREV